MKENNFTDSDFEIVKGTLKKYTGNGGHVVIPDGVKSIDEDAFYGCNAVKSITIPNNVTEIGEWAFSDCGSLASIEVADDNPNYSSVDGVLFNKAKTELITYPIGNLRKSYTIPSSVTKIGKEAFYGCESLEAVNIPNNVTEIGKWTFYKCESLKEINIPNSVTEIGGWAFYKCESLEAITIPDSVTEIGEWAFYECESLEEITIPNSIAEIGEGTFSGCGSLVSFEVADDNPNYSSADGVLFDKAKTELIDYPIGNLRKSYTIPNGVTKIGEWAFDRCKSLTSITIPNSVTKISEWAFTGCKSLTSITIPSSVTEIGAWAFNECESLEAITVPNSVTEIGKGAFFDCYSLASIEVTDDNPNYSSADGVLFDKAKTELITYPIGNLKKSYTIPNGVTEIGDWAFYNCEFLEEITIPNSVTEIGEWAFYECENLSYVLYEGTKEQFETLGVIPVEVKFISNPNS